MIYRQSKSPFNHLYSQEEVLSEVDCLFLLDVYAAGEAPINSADSKSLARSIRQRGQIEPIYVSSAEILAELLQAQLQDGDMVITQGAGTIGVIAREIMINPLLNVDLKGAQK